MVFRNEQRVSGTDASVCGLCHVECSLRSVHFYKLLWHVSGSAIFLAIIEVKGL